MDQSTTPKSIHTKSKRITLPETPLMKSLGCGTGVGVYSLMRSPVAGNIRSPWAIKKVLKNVRRPRIYQQRLEHEAEILKTLDHPNIIGYRDFFHTEDGRECLAMEKCTTSLGQLIDERYENGLGPFPPANILKVALEVAKGLDYLHAEQHLLHGDIKSFNILIKGDFEEVKLCDFGVALPIVKDDEVDVDPDSGEQMEYVGTECWSAPEVLQGDCVTSKADIFSFGLVLYEMIALHPPHVPNDVSDYSDAETKVASDSSREEYDFTVNYGKRPDLPEEPLGEEYSTVLFIFNWCTEQQPSARPTAKEVVHKVAGILAA